MVQPRVQDELQPSIRFLFINSTRHFNHKQDAYNEGVLFLCKVYILGVVWKLSEIKVGHVSKAQKSNKSP